MAIGKRPSARLVYEALGRRGSPNHIIASLERFWRDQAARSEGNPVALSRLPPELADAVIALSYTRGMRGLPTSNLSSKAVGSNSRPSFPVPH